MFSFFRHCTYLLYPNGIPLYTRKQQRGNMGTWESQQLDTIYASNNGLCHWSDGQDLGPRPVSDVVGLIQEAVDARV